MRNAPDAQARSRPPLRERLQASKLGLQAAYLATDVTRRRAACSRLRCVKGRLKKHRYGAKQVSEAQRRTSFVLRAKPAMRPGRGHKTPDSSLFSLRRRRSSAPGAVERHTGRLCALMTKPAAHHAPPSCRSEACIAPRALFEDSFGTNRPSRRAVILCPQSIPRLFCKPGDAALYLSPQDHKRSSAHARRAKRPKTRPMTPHLQS